MDRSQFYGRLARPAESRILYVVIDGLGGLPDEPGGRTELEAAHSPILDHLAREGTTGLITPVLPGVAPGSGPAHLALFGFDPVEDLIGRGVLSALGIGLELEPGDVAGRINLCTLDDDGNVADRRAGRIDSPGARPLVERLDGLDLDDDVECLVRHVKEYRACVVLRGPDLDGRIADTDPQRTGVPPREPEALHPDAQRTARLISRFVARARQLLEDQSRANGLLLRGLDTFHPLPGFAELYGVRPAAVAAYPMYRGVARAVGMKVFPADDTADALAAGVVEAAREHDFVFLHWKSSDSRGEDGDFDAKVEAIEAADGLLGRILEEPGEWDVVMVTGDHSTPAVMRSHSWHPVPLLIHGGPCRGDEAEVFGETACRGGALGALRSLDVLPLVLARAGRLGKFGA